MTLKACVRCKRITEKDRCPLCDSSTSTNWSGTLMIIDPDNSDIAKELKILIPGEYALRVR